MLILLLIHAAVGVFVMSAAPRLGRVGYLLAATPMVATLAVIAVEWGDVLGGAARVDRAVWIEGLQLVAGSRLDGFSLLMVLLVSGMGTLVLAYSASYFGPTARGVRTAGLLVLFGGSMLGLVTADHLIWLYVCWELTSITSYLLIGWTQERADQRTAALQALFVTGAGGLAMLGGFVILAREAGTWSMAEILADPPTGGPVAAALVLVLAGAVTKSAQVPFHFWLPGAMVAPTPISAYLHSATMVKAGIYLVARFAPAFADVGIWKPAVIGLGLTTMLHGGLRALRQHDLKVLLAYGTVSQLGFMLVLAGAGEKGATKAVAVLLVSHGLFKGALFLVVGILDREIGTRDLRELPVLGHGWITVRVVAIASAASMAGVPPVLGFISKESAYEAFAHGGTGEAIALAGLVLGSVITFAYTARLVRPFVAATREGSSPSGPRVAFVAPAAMLAAGTVALGVGVPALDSLIDAAANSLDPRVGDVNLKLWHGFNLALGLSALTIAAGIGLVVVRDRVERGQARWSPRTSADGGFATFIQGLNDVARLTARVAQSGSLPVYLAVILVVVVGAPNVVLLAGSEWPGWPTLYDTPVQAFLAVLLAAASIAVAVLRRRFAAVLALGAVGIVMAAIFAVQGAVDLALTQFAVETLSIVMFVLVIRHLPERFRRSPVIESRPVRAGVALAVGAGVFSLAMMTGAGTPDRPVSEDIVARAEPEGGGKNVVNVILVDVRGLDTLGEIAVLAVAAIGVTAVARVGRRGGSDPDNGEDANGRHLAIADGGSP